MLNYQSLFDVSEAMSTTRIDAFFHQDGNIGDAGSYWQHYPPFFCGLISLIS